jgi:hypothetical protein
LGVINDIWGSNKQLSMGILLDIMNKSRGDLIENKGGYGRGQPGARKWIPGIRPHMDVHAT